MSHMSHIHWVSRQNKLETPKEKDEVKKQNEDRGYKNVTLETIMHTKADKAVKKITHHVPPRQMIYTKKQIGLNHEKR